MIEGRPLCGILVIHCTVGNFRKPDILEAKIANSVTQKYNIDIS